MQFKAALWLDSTLRLWLVALLHNLSTIIPTEYLKVTFLHDINHTVSSLSGVWIRLSLGAKD